MRTTSPAEHDAFAKLTLHLRKAVEAVELIAALRPDQPWDVIGQAFKALTEKVYRLAERGLKH